MATLVRNAADNEQVKRATRKSVDRVKQELEDLRWIISDPRGRRWIYARLTQCGVYRSIFADKAELMFFNEGARNVGLKLLADVESANEKALIVMFTEAHEQAALDRQMLEAEEAQRVRAQDEKPVSEQDAE